MCKALAVGIHAMFHRVFHQGHHHERSHLRLRIFQTDFKLQVKVLIEPQLFQVCILSKDFDILFHRNVLVRRLVEHHTEQLRKFRHALFGKRRINPNQARYVVQGIEQKVRTQLLFQEGEFIRHLGTTLFTHHKSPHDRTARKNNSNANQAYKTQYQEETD